jgi:L-lactate dehydrogenase (cytochrome)
MLISPLMQPGGKELILAEAGKDITKSFTILHPKGTLENTLSPFACVGAVDPNSRPAESVQDQDEDEIEERRQALPPAASVLNISTFEKYAQQVLGEDSRAWVYISGWADDGVCESDVMRKVCAQ